MKRYFRPSALLFYFLCGFVCFGLGIYVAGALGAGEGQMLAAAAIVLGWGFLTGLIGLVAAIVIARNRPTKGLIKLNAMLLAILVLLISITYYRYNERQKSKDSTPVESTTGAPTST